MNIGRHSDADGSIPRVVVILPYVNNYRAPFLVGLREKLEVAGVQLDVLAGRQAGLERGRRDAVPGVARPVSQLTLRLGGKTILARFPPISVLSADLVILEQATRNLESYVILVVRWLLRRPSAQWGHGTTITERQGPLQRHLQQWMMRMSSWFFAYTPGSADRGVGIGATREATTVVYNTIDAAELTARCDQIGLPQPTNDGRWTAIYVGALDESKRIDVLIDIAGSAKRADPRFHLVVAGSGRLENVIADAERAGLLTYIGQVGVDEKVAMARDARVMLNPGRVGLVAIDSFAMRTPILTLSTSMHGPEIEYLNETNSITVETPSACVAAILSLMDDDAKLRHLREGCARSIRGLSMSGMVEKFAEGIVDALPRRSSRECHG